MATSTSPTAVSAPTTNQGLMVQGKAVDDLIRRRAPRSPMIGLGASIVQLGNAYNVSPAVIVGFAGAETSFGTAGQGRESQGRGAFGIKGRSYSSYRDAVEDFAKLISGSGYYGSGLHTIEQIVPKYSPASDGNDEAGHARNISTIAAQLSPGWTVSKDARIIGGDSGRTTLGDLIGDGVGAVTDPIGSAFGGIFEAIKFLLDPKLWLRIGTMILGVIGMVLGALFMFRGSGNSSRLIGLLIVLFGFGWLWAGITNINPIQLVKDVVTG